MRAQRKLAWSQRRPCEYVKCINILRGTAELKLKLPLGADTLRVSVVPRNSLVLLIKL